MVKRQSWRSDWAEEGMRGYGRSPTDTPSETQHGVLV